MKPTSPRPNFVGRGDNIHTYTECNGDVEKISKQWEEKREWFVQTNSVAEDASKDNNARQNNNASRADVATQGCTGMTYANRSTFGRKSGNSRRHNAATVRQRTIGRNTRQPGRQGTRGKQYYQSTVQGSVRNQPRVHGTAGNPRQYRVTFDNTWKRQQYRGRSKVRRPGQFRNAASRSRGRSFQAQGTTRFDQRDPTPKGRGRTNQQRKVGNTHFFFSRQAYLQPGNDKHCI